MEPPRALAGDYVLTDVRRRVRLQGRVADCPACGGYVYEDEWHVAATVARGSLAAPEAAVHHFCSTDCFERWLACYDDAVGTGSDPDAPDAPDAPGARR